MNISTRGGARLHVETRGEGPAILFLHSLGADHHVWDGVAPRMSGGFQVVMPDARGHGQSSKGGISLTSQVQDIEDILDALEIRAAHLVGISMGGVEALAFYRHQPHRVLSLTLVDTFSSIGDQGLNWVRDKEEQLKQQSMDQFARAYVDNTLMPSTGSHMRDFLYQAVAGMTPEDYVDASRACFLAQLDAVLPTVAVPTLVLIGSHDQRTPRPFADHLAEQIQGAEFQVVPNAGHLSAMDNPEFVLEQLVGFLGRP